MRDNHRNESIVPASPDVKDTSADNKLACGDAPSSSSSRPLEEAEITAADDTRISCRRGECWMKAIGMVIMMAFSGLSLALIPGGSSPTSSTAVNRPPPTPRPTHLPTAAPVVLSQTGHVAFTETVQLYEAVDAYFAELEEHGVVSSTANVSLVYGHPIGTWDVSRIVHFDQVFDPARHLRLDPTARDPSAHYHARTRFNDDLSGWDVSNATSLRGMFATASEFTGLGLDRWNVSNVQDFSFMFAWCTSFTGNVSAWNTSNAVYMNHLLFKAIRFDGDVSRWNLSSVVTTEGMFQEASSFTGTTSTNNHSLDEWSVSQVQSMNAMFRGARKFTGTISTWNTAMVLDMRDMFHEATLFNGNLSSWNVANAVRFDSMFQSAISFRGDGLNTWNTSRMSSLAYMFSSAVTFRGILSNWDVAKVTSLEAMFENTGFNGDISAWNVGNVEIANDMFYSNRNFAGDLSAWNTTNLVSAANMFWDADSFNSNLTAWKVSRLVDASGMLFGADRFNHSLCAWRTRLPAAVDVSQILVGTACSETARTDSDSVSDKSTDTLVLCVPCDNVLGL